MLGMAAQWSLTIWGPPRITCGWLPSASPWLLGAAGEFCQESFKEQREGSCWILGICLVWPLIKFKPFIFCLPRAGKKKPVAKGVCLPRSWKRNVSKSVNDIYWETICGQELSEYMECVLMALFLFPKSSVELMDDNQSRFKSVPVFMGCVTWQALNLSEPVSLSGKWGVVMIIPTL